MPKGLAAIWHVVWQSFRGSILLPFPLQWRHNDHDNVSNHQPHGYLLNRLFRRRSKKTSKLCVAGLCVGNSPGPVNSPHNGPVTRKMFPFDDVIMTTVQSLQPIWKSGIRRYGFPVFSRPYPSELTIANSWPSVTCIPILVTNRALSMKGFAKDHHT